MDIKLYFSLWWSGVLIPRLAMMTWKYTRSKDMCLSVQLAEMMSKWRLSALINISHFRWQYYVFLTVLLSLAFFVFSGRNVLIACWNNWLYKYISWEFYSLNQKRRLFLTVANFLLTTFVNSMRWKVVLNKSFFQVGLKNDKSSVDQIMTWRCHHDKINNWCLGLSWCNDLFTS